MMSLASRLLRLRSVSTFQERKLNSICSLDLHTLADQEQLCPDHWADKELAVPHSSYSEAARAVISTVLWRLSNKMTTITKPNALFSDFKEELLDCRTSSDLISKAKEQLAILFPDIKEQRNRCIRNDFFEDANKLVEDDGNILANIEMLKNLVDHPLLKSIEGRTAYICSSIQMYRNFDHQLLSVGPIAVLESVRFHCESMFWQPHYHVVAIGSDCRRLPLRPILYCERDFKNFGFEMSRILNDIIQNNLQGWEAQTRAGHGVVFRHAMEHGNGRMIPRVGDIDRGVMEKNLHWCMGPVVVDIKQYNHLALPGLYFSSCF